MSQKTILKRKSVDPDQATVFYETLKYNIDWEAGIRSRKGFTRKAKAIPPGMYSQVDELIEKTLREMTNDKYHILGIYLNYYENGEMYTPNHRHASTSQLVISLGASRLFQLGQKQYQLDNGDAILFGSTVHGVPKDLSCANGRISIATFMQKI